MDRTELNKLAEQAGFGGNLRRTNAVRIERFANLVRNHALEEVADNLEHVYEDDEGHHIQYASEIRTMKSS